MHCTAHSHWLDSTFNQTIISSPSLSLAAAQMSSFFGFSSAPVDVEIRLNGEDKRKQVEVKGEKDRKELCPVYYDGESVDGQVGQHT